MLRSEVGHEKSFSVPQLKGGKKGAGAPLTLDLSGTEATLATLVDSLIYYFRMLTEWGGHTVRVIGNAKNFATRFVRGAKKCGLKVCRRPSRADESGCCEPLRCSAVRRAVVVVVRLAFEKEPWHGCLRFSVVRYGCIEVYYCMVHPSNAGNMFQHPSAPNKAGVSARSAACCSEPGELFKAAAQCKNG